MMFSLFSLNQTKPTKKNKLTNKLTKKFQPLDLSVNKAAKYNNNIIIGLLIKSLWNGTDSTNYFTLLKSTTVCKLNINF